jgi:hypothetical protein
MTDVTHAKVNGGIYPLVREFTFYTSLQGPTLGFDPSRKPEKRVIGP